MTTPMLTQYEEIKAQVPEAVLFFRMGDFYEMFGDDALKTAPLLDIALTARDSGQGQKTPMCGVPYHSVHGYLTRLVALGKKVAICEQVEDPKTAKGLVKREIVRLVTPGTMEDEVNEKGCYLAALWHERVWGLAYADLSTGDFALLESESFTAILTELSLLMPAELLLPPGVNREEFARYYISDLPTGAEEYLPVLAERFAGQAEALGERVAAAVAAAGLWLYVEKTMPHSQKEHILTLRCPETSDHMPLDYHTRRNLELTESLRGADKGTLLSVLRLTKTSSGTRLLREMILRPLIRLDVAMTRQEKVEALYTDARLRSELRQILSGQQDMERLLGRLSLGRGNARDLLSLGRVLALLPAVRELLSSAPALAPYMATLSGLEVLAAELPAAILPEAGTGLKEGGIIQDGYDAGVDELRSLARGGREWMANLESRERERTGVKTLKVGFTRVFGYYIELTRANAHLAPADYERRQTLAGAERYTLPELKDYEKKILTAEEELGAAEYEIFLRLRDQVFAAAGGITQAAKALAELDVWAALAEVAVQNNYVKPHLAEKGDLEIVDGRHPVIEKWRQDTDFVPNDTKLTTKKHLALITGPNMAGKSTYMRQVALIVLMAQMGSFVPAARAHIPLRDCIYTRIGASDNLTEGDSTFMVEMREVAAILQNATSRSLVIMDEVGRGTATFDGLSLAWALSEYLTNHPEFKPFTLFATHYHELTTLEQSGMFNLQVAVSESKGEIVFLHKILPGNADRSYGLQVARLAGLPQELLERAGRILSELENSDGHRRKLKAAQTRVIQPSLFEGAAEHPLLTELKALDPDNLTARQALTQLCAWQEKWGKKK
jgi:DNA mismatch repair protein MutS